MSVIEKLNNINEYLESSKKVMGKSVIDVEKIKETNSIELIVKTLFEENGFLISETVLSKYYLLIFYYLCNFLYILTDLIKYKLLKQKKLRLKAYYKSNES